MTPLKRFIQTVTSLFTSSSPIKKKRGRKPWVPPSGIDWSRPAAHIAKDCGVTPATVVRHQRSLGLPVRKRGLIRGTRLPQTRKFDRTTLDWRQTDTALGRQHGVSRERIRQVRKKAGHPPSGSRAWRANGGVTVNPKGGRKP